MTFASYTSWDQLSNEALVEWLEFNSSPDFSSSHHIPDTQTQLRQEIRRLYDHFNTTVFVLWEDDKILANITVLRHLNPSEQQPLNPQEAMCCQFNLKNPENNQEFFDKVFTELQQHNITRLLGPMHGDTWHRYRMNTGPNTDKLFLMEPNQPQRYPDLWQSSGFIPLATYHSSKVTQLAKARERMARAREWANTQKIYIKDIKGQSLDKVLQRIHDLTLKSFSKNYLYEPIDFNAFKTLYQGVQVLLQPRLVLFAQDANGKDLGYLFAFPDYAPSLIQRAREGKLTAYLSVLLKRHRPDTINVKTLGVIPMPRRAAVGMALMHELYHRAESYSSCQQVNLCLMKDDNASRSLDGGQGEMFRSYALYEKRLNHGL